MVPVNHDTLLMVGGIVLAAQAYHSSRSPALRADELCNVVDSLAGMCDQNLDKVKSLSDEDKKKEVAETAQDQHNTFFRAKMDAHHIRAELRREGFIQRHLKSDFVCLKDGEQLTLSEIESTAYTHDQDVVATSTRVKELEDEQKEADRLAMEQMNQAEEGRRPPPAAGPSRQNPFVEPRQSFDYNLEAGHGLLGL
jgi:hypothetical protein